MSGLPSAERAAAARQDDWDSHWTQYAESNDLNPANDYRRQLIHEALDL